MATLDEIIGTDIAHKSDLVRSSIGDLATITGLPNLINRLFRRLITTPGSIVHRPTYGCGLMDFQNAPPTLDSQRKIAQRINAQFPLDPMVDKVSGVSVTFDSVNPALTTIKVRVVIIGYGELPMNFKPFSEGVA